MNHDAGVRTSPCDCTKPIEALLRLNYRVGREEATIDGRALATTSDWHGPDFEWPKLFNQLAHGSIANLIPKELYAFTSVANESDIPELSELQSVYGTFIVGSRMKAVIESFSIPKSELFPIKMVLRHKDARDLVSGDDYDSMGGGAVVEGKHWLWHVYNRHELIDWKNSVAQPYWIEQPRHDLPGSPIQRFSMMNNKEKISLHQLDYDNNPVFQILGGSNVFVSPGFALAIADAGILGYSNERYATAVISPYFLDLRRQTACQIECRQNSKSKMPLIKIFGTDITEENDYMNVASERFIQRCDMFLRQRDQQINTPSDSV